MMKRLQTAVLDMHPDLVIWQVGTNAVLRNLDPAETIKLVEEGVAQIQAPAPIWCWSIRNIRRRSTRAPKAPAR